MSHVTSLKPLQSGGTRAGVEITPEGIDTLMFLAPNSSDLALRPVALLIQKKEARTALGRGSAELNMFA